LKFDVKRASADVSQLLVCEHVKMLAPGLVFIGKTSASEQFRHRKLKFED